ncbi:glutathione synthase [Metschnikowia bicuspidata var. bicuspidata NRRL YB-4993]|uniref:Glutathione synthetase n=1 Tax=Metschnikowia bicuspidata var. bicuspidata NRRL YB-4993 TaxID=869754 RepID=A0A1A0HKJ9_9ASCO|nr:glutathione synthase [Metschnikowia bicuspidata var. bicuspidata NRRL YB-4993]OBA24333.1 glutathione synthase [Metschnikowia bicuspidata var. bicuspidata NRRL YB-4993]
MTHKEFPALSADNKDLLVEELLQWCLANGLVMYPPNFHKFSANNAPITLFPTPFPKDMFERAVAVQKLFNSLYASVVARQKPWLLEVVSKLAVFDAGFTGKLYETYTKAVEIGGGSVVQPLTLGVFRSDYMYDELTHAIKQIEFNTVSVSFGGLSSKVGHAHTYLNKRGSYDDKYSQKFYQDEELPISKSISEIALGLAKGNFFYNDHKENTSTVILFVVQNGERNCFDQRHIEYELLEKHGLKSYRLSLEQIQEHTTINQGNLYIKLTMDEVSVVYYRSGYAPLDYESNPEATWDARLHLESTKAIKCPSLLTQLSGAKKIQQVLTVPEVVRSFLPDISTKELDNLLSTFVKIYPLDDSAEGTAAKKLAFESPEKFVLKPQREGGGNNVYKQNIPGFLKSLNEKDWGAYILMELINPPTHGNTILRNDELYQEDIISELGIFGNVVFNENTGDVLLNENAGFLLRSKFSSSDEGGVAAGFGCVDNVYLY